MKWTQNHDRAQYCPRCGLKSYEGIESCPDCGFIFSRLKIATNKDAKNKILRHDRDFIVKTNIIPSDVSYIKLLLYCIFFGMFGTHCFYVGRYLRGSFILADFVAMILLVVFNGKISSINDGALLNVLSTICGLIMLAWMWDIFMIIFKKFKIPVAIDIDRVNQEELSNIEILSKENNLKEDFKIENKDVVIKKVNNNLKNAKLNFIKQIQTGNFIYKNNHLKFEEDKETKKSQNSNKEVEK